MILAIGKDWWLPPNYSVHGREIDALHLWFFWITAAALVLVQVGLVYLLLKYRARPGRRARYTHGSLRLEMSWTAATTIILSAMSLAGKKVWDDYRNSPDLNNPQRSQILVIGQQFKWNVVYPGPDGKIGRYLVYPKPTDLKWPVGPGGKPTRFAGVDGPAALPTRRAADAAVSTYIDQENRLGKDYTDVDGADDDTGPAGRPIYVPVNRPVEIQLQSKDVIHDFYLPNFRAQLYAVPGMVGRFVFTPTITTADLERPSRVTVSVDDLIATGPGDRVIDIDATTPGATRDAFGYRFAEPSKKKKAPTIIRDGAAVTIEVANGLKKAGVDRITVHTPAPFEIACAQLCGAQHYTMRGVMIVLTQAEFDKRFPAYPYAGK